MIRNYVSNVMSDDASNFQFINDATGINMIRVYLAKGRITFTRNFERKFNKINFQNTRGSYTWYSTRSTQFKQHTSTEPPENTVHIILNYANNYIIM